MAHMSSMESGGHGHEKKHGHESHGAKHSAWKEKALKGLQAVGIGSAVMTSAYVALALSGIIVPPYMLWGMGAGAVGFHLDDKSGGAKKGGHGGHH
jgi:hypothetical protein